MDDVRTAAISAARRSLERYCRLLATPLTELERDYIHRRISQVQQSLAELLADTERGRTPPPPWHRPLEPAGPPRAGPMRGGGKGWARASAEAHGGARPITSSLQSRGSRLIPPAENRTGLPSARQG